MSTRCYPCALAESTRPRLHGIETLEGRLLLSATPADEGEALVFSDPLGNELAADGSDLASLFWQVLSQEELLDAAEAELDAMDDSLPIVPIDDTVDPGDDVPGLQTSVDGLLPGDANGDGVVDFADFLALGANFGVEDASWQQGDFDGDGVVAFADFLILASHFGTSV